MSPRTAGRQPLLWVALSFAAGLSTGLYAWRPPLWWLVAAVVFAAAGFYLSRRKVWSAYVLGLGTIFTIGALTIQAGRASGSSGASVIEFADGREVIVTAHVTSEGMQRSDSPGEASQRIDIETERIAINNQSLPARSGIRLSVFTKEDGDAVAGETVFIQHVFHYGDRLRFPARIYPPRNFRNPDAFDYQGYLSENGIAALASAKSADIELLPGFAGNRAEFWRTRIRRSIIQRIHILWPAGKAELMEAMLLGDESVISRDVLFDFQRSGIYHVLVASGLKVGILALGTFWLLRRLRLNDFAASAIAVLLPVAYAVLTDVGAPVWRATLMLILYLAAKVLYRQKSTLNTVGAAALALLIVNPRALFGASFQLSFLCVLVIAGIGVAIIERIPQPIVRALRYLDSLGYDRALTPRLVQFRLDLRMIAGRLQRFAGKRIPSFTLISAWRITLAASEFVIVSIILQAGFAVLANFHPRELWLGVDSPALELQSLLSEARKLGIVVVEHKAGDNLELGGAAVRILAPPPDADAKSLRPNEASLVMKISYGSTSALLEGDAERKTERLVAQEQAQADLLKVGHHGSATSTWPEFLLAVQPRFAVISVGTRNVYGHPREDVLERSADSKVSTYRTDINGAVTFYLDGKNVTSQPADLGQW